MRNKTLLALLAASAVLVACGGGGGNSIADNVGGGVGGGGTGGEAPASAFASVDAFIAFVRSLNNDETSEPLALPSTPAPTSDTAEPTA